MNFQNAVVAVTGASGLVGRECCRALTQAGAIVRAMVRDPSRADTICNNGAFHFDLGGEWDERALSSPVDVLIHCACAMQGDRDQAWRCNVDGTRRLLDFAAAAGVRRIIFISSAAAHEQARSAYGRSKWLLEAEVESRNGCSIKPGLIVGPGGMFLRVRTLMKKLPLLPVFYARRTIQTVYIDDVITAIMRVVQREITGRLVVAEPQGVRHADFYRGIATLDGRRKLLLQFPGDVALVIAEALESLGLQPPISSDNLRGIRHSQRFDTAGTNQLLELYPRDFWQSIAELARREADAQAVRSEMSK